MPKIITPAMRAHLDAETTRLAAIWRITRKDGAQFFFTDHDRDIVFGGEVYRADAGFERTAIRSDAGFAVDNLDLVGVFAEGGIVEDEVRAGLFDGAEIAVSFVNWEDPDGHGEIRLRRGTLGETRLTPQGYFHAELRGLSQPLAQSTLEVFSPNCRADLGDERCKFPIQPPELGRNQAVSEGAFYRVPTAAGTGSARYEDRIYEVIEAGTTASSQPAYDTTIGAATMDGTAVLKAYDSFTRVALVESVTDHRIFTVSEDLSGFADSWFDEGAVTFETGANAGRTIEVKSWMQAIRRLELWAPTGLPVGSAISCGSIPAATSACSRTAGTGSGSRAACCSTRATSGIFGASRTCPGARSRPCRLVGALMPSELGSSIGRFGLIAAGGYAFGPIGAAAGALLGGFLFGSSGPKIEGPRLGDLDVSSSTYGGVIPLAFGVQKVAGAMIWATDIDEDKNTRKEGGSLFGGGQKIVEYRYFANFAVAFGEGPAGGVLRIWAGDRLIADLRAGAGAYSNHPKYSFRIYLGTEDQEPDRLIRQHIENSDEFDGHDATPAFRGLVYIVLEDLPLDEFGNRIPGITAEIAWAGAPQAVVKDTTFLPGAGYFTNSAVLIRSGGFSGSRRRRTGSVAFAPPAWSRTCGCRRPSSASTWPA